MAWVTNWFGEAGLATVVALHLRPTGEADRLVSGLHASGDFMISSAWKAIRPGSPDCPIAGRFLQKCIPSKWYILIWRAIPSKLPTDDVLISIGYSLASQCHCCEERSGETAPYIFVHGDMAAVVWDYFGVITGIGGCGLGLQELPLAWGSVAGTKFWLRLSFGCFGKL